MSFPGQSDHRFQGLSFRQHAADMPHFISFVCVLNPPGKRDFLGAACGPAPWSAIADPLPESATAQYSTGRFLLLSRRIANPSLAQIRSVRLWLFTCPSFLIVHERGDCRIVNICELVLSFFISDPDRLYCFPCNGLLIWEDSAIGKLSVRFAQRWIPNVWPRFSLFWASEVFSQEVPANFIVQA
jgi:hypothetical protein